MMEWILKLTEQAYVDGNIYLLQNNSFQRKQVRWMRIISRILGIICLVSALLMTITGDWYLSVCMFMLGIFAVSIPMAKASLIAWSLKRMYKSSYADVDKAISKLTLTDEDITTTLVGTTVSHKISSLKSVVETKDYFFVNVADNMVTVLEKNELGDVDEFRNLLKNRMKSYGTPFEVRMDWSNKGI